MLHVKEERLIFNTGTHVLRAVFDVSLAGHFVAGWRGPFLVGVQENAVCISRTRGRLEG